MSLEPSTTEVLSPVAQGNWFSYTFRDGANVKALQNQKMQIQVAIQSAMHQYELFYQTLQEMPLIGENGAAEIRLLEVEGCTLYEPRAGRRVTERQTQSGGRPFVGTKLGGIFVGTSLGSKSTSQSVSYQLPDELKQIDTGSIIVTTRTLSFVGDMYSRSVKFTNLVSWHGEDTRMSVAASNRQALSIFDFAQAAQLWVAGVLVDTSQRFAQRRLDTSGKDSVDSLRQQFVEVVGEQENELERAFTQAFTELERVNAQLRFYYGKYPTRVQDPGPEEKFAPRPRFSFPPA